MEEKKYLNEETYQKSKSKLKTVAIIVLIIGLLIGGGLIATGVIKSNAAKLTTEEISRVQTLIDSYDSQLSSLKAQKSQEFLNNGHSEKYYNLDNEINKIIDKIHELEDSLDKDTSWLVIFYIFGGFIVICTFMVSCIISANANGREISAFYAQQQIPIAKEGIEKMAPSVGNVAKEITKGIKEGLNNNED